MGRYFTALMSWMVSWTVIGPMLVGSDSKEETSFNLITSLAIGYMVYWLYPIFTNRKK